MDIPGLLIRCAVCCLAVAAADIAKDRLTYDGAQLWRIDLQAGDKNDYIDYLQKRGDLSLWTGNDTSMDVLVLPDVIPRVSRFLHKQNINYDVVIGDLQQAIDHENPVQSEEFFEQLEGRNARYAWWKTTLQVTGMRKKYTYCSYCPPRYPVANSLDAGGGGGDRPWQWKGHRMEWTSYHRLEDIHGYLDYLANTYPHICSVMTIGKSVEGRPLKVLRISKGIENATAIWIDGGIHAREWISPAAVTYVIDYLVEHSEQLEVDYYILPVVNPDGYEYTFRGDRLWRKNRARTEKGSSCIGVDLNRNFGYRWGGLGTSKQPCRETYAGTGPFSEPETNAIRNFFDISAANFKAYLSFHSYGQFILYCWGYDRVVPPDYKDLDNVGRSMAAAMRAAGSNTEYTVGNSATTLYPAAGGSDDWAKGLANIKYAYTIELRDKGKYGFILPAMYIKPTALEALAAVQVVSRAVLAN
ncbi:carboxypeptidase B-like [Copidosoma floridanum]|uniref:carboxypeptidase B-like n=1 Tax=Copidosoma floridanum TaxID=29053 RepID=UPI000C6FA240|nr:carboxypeptidase B-like [Copidosoma floridanum]